MLRVLDLCAGSGAIGLSILNHCPNAHVTFGELVPEHAELIQKNLEQNRLDASRADIRCGDLFAPFSTPSERDSRLKRLRLGQAPRSDLFDIIATNPPYIPEKRALPESVASFEPHEALFAGLDGLDIIRRILTDAPTHVHEKAELWMECDAAESLTRGDTSNIKEAKRLALVAGAHRTDIRNDQYGRSRLLVAYW